MGVAGSIVALLVYHAVLYSAASWCKRNDLSKHQAFVFGVGICILLTAILVGVSKMYFGRFMLVNDSLLLSVLCIVILCGLGGLHCRDYLTRWERTHET